MKLLLNKSDALGATAGTLCLIHCLATPFIFIAQACTATCCEATPLWWQWIDYLFLGISFLAVYHSTQKTSKSFMKPALWFSWCLLFVVIVNEKLQWLPLPEVLVYVAAFVLVGLHLYNLKYCQCQTNNCCIKNEE